MTAAAVMEDRPDAAELLAEAHRTFMERLLPALPDGLRYEALMVGSALATAGRELRQGQGVAEAERGAAEALLGEAAGGGDAEAVRRRLAGAIRDGRLDASLDSPDALRILQRVIEARLRISNPKAVQGRS